MSDGGSSGLSGTFEFIGQGAKQGAQNLVQGAGSMVSSAAKQVAGSGGVGAGPNMSGSFDLKAGTGGSVDLFSPDAQKPGNTAKQMFGNTKPLTQAGQSAVTNDRVYTPEELEKIQKIEAELKSMHAQNNDIQGQMDEVRRKREEAYQAKLQDDAQRAQSTQMGDLQQQGGKVDQNVFNAARATEHAKGDLG